MPGVSVWVEGVESGVVSMEEGIWSCRGVVGTGVGGALSIVDDVVEAVSRFTFRGLTFLVYFRLGLGPGGRKVNTGVAPVE
jgi:hypothetical protein